MARKAKNDEVNGIDTEVTPARKVYPALSQAQKKALFASYDKADEKLQAAKNAVDTALAERSKTVQAIVDSMGAGPFDYNGKILTAISRKSNDGTVTVFFKSAGEREVVKI